MNMKPLIIFLCLLITGVGFAQEAKPEPEQEMEPTSRFVECKKEEATISLTLVCSLDGIFKERKHVFYFRPARRADEWSGLGNVMVNADGIDGTGYGFSVGAWPKNTAVEVEASAYWTTKTAHGKNQITLLVPYFEEKKGKDVGFSYSVTWQRLDEKKETNP